VNQPLAKPRRAATGEAIVQRGHGFVRLLGAAWVEYERDRAGYLAVAMIYYAIVSMIPLLLLLLAALGLLLRFSATAADAQQQTLLGIEASFGAELRATITRLLNGLAQGSIIATVISLGGLFLAASVLFRHLRLSFRAIWNYEPPLVSGPIRVVVWTTILERVIAFVMVLAGGGLLLIALVLITAIQWLDRLLSDVPLVSHRTEWLLTAVSSLIIATITFACLFRVLPPIAIRWRHVWLAALLCAVSWVVASELLALYGVFFGNSRNAYGALGALLAVMLWMNIVSKVLFFGAELCKVVVANDGSP
jgi:membrane protein